MKDFIKEYLSVISESADNICINVLYGSEFMDEADIAILHRLSKEAVENDEYIERMYVKKQPVKICDLNMKKFFTVNELPDVDEDRFAKPNVSKINLKAEVYVMGAVICFAPTYVEDEDGEVIADVKTFVMPLVAFCFNKKHIDSLEVDGLIDCLTSEESYYDFQRNGHRLLYQSEYFPWYMSMKEFHPNELEEAFEKIGDVYAWYWAADYVDYEFEKDVSNYEPEKLYDVVKDTLKEFA